MYFVNKGNQKHSLRPNFRPASLTSNFVIIIIAIWPGHKFERVTDLSELQIWTDQEFERAHTEIKVSYYYRNVYFMFYKSCL